MDGRGANLDGCNQDEGDQPPHNSNQFATFWPMIFPTFPSPFHMGWDFYNSGQTPFPFNNNSMRAGYVFGQDGPVSSTDFTPHEEMSSTPMTSKSTCQVLSSDNSTSNVCSLVSGTPPMASDRPSVGVTPSADKLPSSHRSLEFPSAEIESSSQSQTKQDHDKPSDSTTLATADLSSLKQKAKESVSRRKVRSDSQVQQIRVADTGKVRPQCAKDAVQQLREMTETLRHQMPLSDRQLQAAPVPRKKPEEEKARDTPKQTHGSLSTFDDGAVMQDVSIEEETNIDMDTVEQQLQELLAEERMAVATAREDQIEQNEVSLSRMEERGLPRRSRLSHGRNSRLTAAEMNSLLANEEASECAGIPGTPGSFGRPSLMTEKNSSASLNEQEWTSDHDTYNSSEGNQLTSTQSKKKDQPARKENQPLDVQAKNNSGTPADPNSQIKDELESVAHLATGASNEQTKMVNRNEHEIEEWLTITGFHDQTFREKTLTRYRRLKEIEEERLMLLKEADEDSSSEVFLKPSVMLNAVKGRGTPHQVTAIPTSAREIKEIKEEPPISETGRQEHCTNKPSLKRSKEMTRSREDLSTRPKKVPKPNEAAAKSKRNSLDMAKVPTSPASGSRRTYDSYHPEEYIRNDMPLTTNDQRDRNGRGEWEPPRGANNPGFAPYRGRGPSYWDPVRGNHQYREGIGRANGNDRNSQRGRADLFDRVERRPFEYDRRR